MQILFSLINARICLFENSLELHFLEFWVFKADCSDMAAFKVSRRNCIDKSTFFRDFYLKKLVFSWSLKQSYKNIQIFVGGVLFLAILIADPNDFWPHFVVYKAQKSKSNIVNRNSKFPITFFGHFQGKICKMPSFEA